MRVGSLFSGIGGFDYALEKLGMQIVWQSEIDPYACAVLRKHWPRVPNLGDIRGIVADVQDSERIGCAHQWTEKPGDPGDKRQSSARGGEWLRKATVDLICGGPPCQPASVAGLRKGTEDYRWLWGETVRVVGEFRPRWCLFENPPGILSLQGGLPFKQVLADLEALGYEVCCFNIPACAVDAPHQRKRIWIVAYAKQSQCGWGADQSKWYAKRRITSCGSGPDVADNGGARLPEWESQRGDAGAQQPATIGDGGPEKLVKSPLGVLADGVPPRLVRWCDEPEGVPRVAVGVESRKEQLRCLGNAVVPKVVEELGAMILHADAIFESGR